MPTPATLLGLALAYVCILFAVAWKAARLDSGAHTPRLDDFPIQPLLQPHHAQSHTDFMRSGPSTRADAVRRVG